MARALCLASRVFGLVCFAFLLYASETMKTDSRLNFAYTSGPCIFGAQTRQFANLWRCVGVANGTATFPSLNTNCRRVVQSLSFE